MSELVDVAGVEELTPDKPRLVDVAGTPVCIVNDGGVIRAIHDVCTHMEEPLHDGWVENGRIECPRHGAFFSLETGEPDTPPATTAVPTFQVTVRDGRVLVDPVPSHPHPLLDS